MRKKGAARAAVEAARPSNLRRRPQTSVVS
jgi:hypothetical protein